MSKFTLNTVNYYSPSDIYSFETDNRPLVDISSNIDILNSGMSQLGFYGEYTANPQFEPSGGFQPYTCVYVGSNGQLNPIDISTSKLVLDYTQYPIALILENNSPNYQVLFFSASLPLPGSSQFLSTSMGAALQIGPGGSLVDEYTFQLSYASYGYQNLYVGKILTPTSISFGGNQVSTLSDNRYLVKDREDSSTGLITELRDSQSSLISHKTVVSNSINLPYPYLEYQDSIGNYSDYLLQQQPVPIYFTYTTLNEDPSSGQFTTNVAQSLNELHFSTPTISSSSISDQYLTAGMNIGSFLSYATNYLLHSVQLSNSLSEASQTISTSLVFDNTVNSSTILGFNQILYDTGTTLDATSSYPNTLLSNLQSTQLKGITFNTYSTGTGSFIGYVTDSNTLAAIPQTTINSLDITKLKNSHSLLIHSTATDSYLSNIFLISSGYISLSATSGVIYSNTPTLNYEITNKQYVDQAVLSAVGTAATKVPLAGNTSDTPITASLYIDATTSTEPSNVLKFNTLTNTDILSSNPVEFKALATSDYQVVRGLTLPDSTGNSNDFTTRSYVTTAISSAISGAIGTNYVTTSGGAQTISSAKTFSSTITSQNTIPLAFSGSGAGQLQITSDVSLISFIPSGTNTSVKLETSPTVSADADTVVVTKGYLNSLLASNASVPCFGTWPWSTSLMKVTLTGTYYNWYNCTGGLPPTQQVNFNTLFTAASDGGWVYSGTSPAIFNISVADGRWNGHGNFLNSGIVRTQTAIIAKLSGALVVLSAAIDQVDTAGDNVNTQVGTSCSTSIQLNPNDIIYMVSEDSDHVSASIVKIG